MRYSSLPPSWTLMTKPVVRSQLPDSSSTTWMPRARARAHRPSKRRSRESAAMGRLAGTSQTSARTGRTVPLSRASHSIHSRRAPSSYSNVPWVLPPPGRSRATPGPTRTSPATARAISGAAGTGTRSSESRAERTTGLDLVGRVGPLRGERAETCRGRGASRLGPHRRAHGSSPRHHRALDCW